MQQIERYGVIALVFLLVTIVAVSFWGDSKSPGFWSRLTGKSDGTKEVVAEKPVEPSALVTDHVADANLPLNTGATPITLPGGTPTNVANGNTPSITDTPVAGTGTVGGPIGSGNPFLPGTLGSNTTSGIGQAPIVTPIAPPPAANDYVVKSGDSLALIARRQLGAESRWTEIQAANPGLDPKRLAPGMTLHLPAGGSTIAAAPSTTKTAVAKTTTKSVTKPVVADAKKAPATKATSTYTVKKGDLLRTIAREKLGDENRWKDIVAANPGLDPQKLAVGQQIKLPVSESRRPVAAATVASVEKPASKGKPTVR